MRVIFALVKPRTIRPAMIGSRDGVRAWLRASG
jgi:hypothetical protein